MNVLEPRLLAIAAIVDNEVPALEPDLGQVATVKAKRTEAVDPREEGGKILLQAPLRFAGSVGVRHGRWRALRSDRERRRRRQRALLGTGRYRHRTVGFDPHRELRAHQIQSLRARVPA